MAVYRRNILAAVSAALLLLTPASALAQSAIDGLATANKLLHDGDPAKALDQIAEVFSKEKLDNDTTAKALLLRGEIHEKLGKMALAYADYNGAVWLGGLSSAERNRANEGIQRAQATLGVAAGGATHTAHGGAQTSAQGSQGGSSNFLGGLFGGGGSDSAKPAEPAKAAEPARAPEANKSAASAKKPEAAQGWGVQGASVTSRKLAGPGAVPPPPPPPAEPAAEDSARTFYTQFAAMPNEGKALTEAKRLAKKLGGSLSGRPVLVVKTQAPGKPALFRVVTGPLANKSEAGELCNTLKTQGASCMVYAP